MSDGRQLTAADLRRVANWVREDPNAAPFPGVTLSALEGCADLAERAERAEAERDAALATIARVCLAMRVQYDCIDGAMEPKFSGGWLWLPDVRAALDGKKGAVE